MLLDQRQNHETEQNAQKQSRSNSHTLFLKKVEQGLGAQLSGRMLAYHEQSPALSSIPSTAKEKQNKTKKPQSKMEKMEQLYRYTMGDKT